MASKILIIEDEKDLCEVMGEKLKKKGYEVFQAFNGADGLQIAVQMRPDLILLDILLPDMNGLLVLERLREYDWGRKIKVIILSAYGHEDKQEKAMELGAYDYLVKTEVNIDEVARRVMQAIGQ